MSCSSITSLRLHELVNYCPESGEFTRKVNSRKGASKAGDRCGHIERTGYSAFWVDGKKYLAHRLAWLYMTGDWPKGQIDHANGDRADNRWANLRDVTNGENQQNLGGPKRHNTSGFLGVSKNKSRWKAEIRVDGRRTHIGTFDTPEEAHLAYLSAKKRLHGGSARVQ